eukprot:9424357-Alexandrium_andersonii.AAC.1
MGGSEFRRFQAAAGPVHAGTAPPRVGFRAYSLSLARGSGERVLVPTHDCSTYVHACVRSCVRVG